MISLSRLLPLGWRRRSRAKLRLADAYRSVFSGRGSKEDAEIVLADLAQFSGFYTVTTPNTPADAVRFAEGQRSVMARVLRFTRLSGVETRELEEAARLETQTSNIEGNF